MVAVISNTNRNGVMKLLYLANVKKRASLHLGHQVKINSLRMNIGLVWYRQATLRPAI